jgi:hypothetical protein
MRTSIGKETLGGGGTVPGAAAAQANRGAEEAPARARRPRLGHGEDAAWGESILGSRGAGGGG